MKIYINSIDIETYGGEFLTPYCFAVIYNNKKVVFYGLDCVVKALSWIFSNSSRDSVYYAHNLTFDGNIILNFIPLFYELSLRDTVLRRGDFYSMCLISSGKRIFFKCSAKILPLPLDDISYIFNIGSKQFVDHSFANEKTINDVFFKNKIIKYCANDALLVVRFLEKIILSLKNFIDFKNVYSMSGLSLKMFGDKFNSFNIPLFSTLEYDNLIRPAYYGGRCEVFGNLKKNEQCFHFDFSGMYTNRLFENYPYGTYYIDKNLFFIDKPGFYYVSVFSDINFPILPFRDTSSGKLLFPNGSFEGLYWYEELLLFKKNGGVIEKVHYGVIFEKTDYIFKDFGVLCDNNRKISTYDKVLWKLIPNSFIGRMGLKPDPEKTLIIKDSDYDPRSLDVICDKKINNNWIVRIKETKISSDQKNNVAYPAIITSKARILWWLSAQEVIKNGGRILYCDTDSIFAAFDKNNSPLDKLHGEVFWDSNKEDTMLDDACFVSSKIYCISYAGQSKVKIKGVSRNTIKDLDMLSFKKSFFNNEIKSFKSLNFEKTKLNIKITELNKLIDFSFYDKRIFNFDRTETSSVKIKKNYPI